MTIEFKDRGIFNGVPGTVFTVIDAVTREELDHGTKGLATDAAMQSMGELFVGKTEPLTFTNQYTGKEHRVEVETILDAFKEVDLDNRFLRIATIFRPDTQQKVYPSDMVDTLRRGGLPEQEIQDLLAWEKTVRK